MRLFDLKRVHNSDDMIDPEIEREGLVRFALRISSQSASRPL